MVVTAFDLNLQV